MNLTFIGLGNMGLPMATNLIRAGHNVTVWNRTPRPCEGATIAPSLPDALRQATIVHTMLANDEALEAVTFGESGLLANLPPNALHIGHSTISTDLAKRLAAAHAAHNQRYMSVPVFGRPPAAAAAKLVTVAAGNPADIAEIQPLLEAIGRKSYTAGPEPWHANMVKVTGNFMIASLLETFGEAAAAMRKAEIDPALFLEIINTLFQSPVYEGYGKAIVNQQYEPAGFYLHLGLKDAKLALAASESVGAPMPIASLVRDRYLAAIARGFGQQDWAAIARMAALDAGLE